MAMSEREAIARRNFRAARKAIPERYLPFFDAIVLDDIPLRRATRLATCSTARAPALFCELAQALADFREQHCDD